MRVWTRFLLLLGFLLCGGCGKSKSTEELLADLKSGEKHDRVAAARLLPYKRGDADKVIPAMIESLKDNNTRIRQSAAIALGQFGEQAKEAIPALRAAENDPDPPVRRAAGIALTRIDPQLTPKPAVKPRGKK